MNKVRIKPISKEDIPDKVRWYNNEDINTFLHYEEKFTIEESFEWLDSIKEDNTRYENIIQVEEKGVYNNIGVIGLFNIDINNKKAGFYITIGEKEYQGRGLATKATIQFLDRCYSVFDLEKIYLYTDVGNVVAQRLYERIGFKQEGLLRKELFYKGLFIDRYYYGIFRQEYYKLYPNEGD